MDIPKEELLHDIRMSQLSSIMEEETFNAVLKEVDPTIWDGVLATPYAYEDTKDFVVAEANAMSNSSCHVEPDNSGYNSNPLVSYHHGAPTPQSMSVIPTNEDFPGDYNFEILLSSQSSTKYNWVYSQPLNKVFINMGNPLPVDFKWVPAIPELWVRATPLFALPQHSQEHVLRCLSHSNRSDVSNKDVPEFMHQHVIRCNHSLTRYCNESDGRLTVLAPLGKPQAGTDFVRLMYTFMCKNSCASGMNRKPLEIVYTLETPTGEILGRRKHGVRICSCPKRDKDKEENENKCNTGKKRKHSNGIPPAKRAIVTKDESVDLITYKVPPFEIVGYENLKQILKYAYNLMAGDAMRSNTGDFYRPYLDKLERETKALD